MPVEVVVYLRSLDRSPFVRAYLVDLVLTHGTETHPLYCRALEVRDATWVDADTTAIRAWDERAPTVREVLDAVEAEREALDRDRALRTALLSKQDFADRLREVRLPPGNLTFLRGTQGLLDDLQRTLGGRRGPLDEALEDALDLSTTVENTTREKADLRRRLEQARKNLVRAEADQDLADEAARLCDPDPKGLPPDSTDAPDSVECQQRIVETESALGVVQRRKSLVDSLSREIRDVEWALDSLDGVAQTALASIASEYAVLAESLDRTGMLLDIARSAPTSSGGAVVALDDIRLPASTAPAAAALPESPQQALWALTNFLYARAQQEVALTFVDQIADWLKTSERATALRLAFPTTASVLASPSDAVFLDRTLLATSLQHDFVELPTALFKDDALFTELIGASPPLAFKHARALYTVAAPLTRGEAPVEVATRLDEAACDLFAAAESADLPVCSVSGIVSAVAEEVRLHGSGALTLPDSAVPPPYLLSARQVFRASPQRQDLYWKLLAADVLQSAGVAAWVESIHFKQELRIDDIALRTLSALERAQRTLAAVEGSADGYGAYLEAGMDVAILILDLADEFHVTDTFDPIPTTRRSWGRVAGLYRALHSRNYTQALTMALVLIQEARCPTGAVDCTASIDSNFLRLATLAASLSAAESGEAMQAAFQAAALPAGGYRTKRRNDSSEFTLNAYPGIGGGYERDLGVADGGAIAVALPVGIEYRASSNLGVFFPLIDLGALLSYRLGDDHVSDSEGDGTLSDLPDVSFAQAFSPGAYLLWNPTPRRSNSPITIGVGLQLNPALRTLDRVGDDDERVAALRVGGFVGLDLTLFQF